MLQQTGSTTALFNEINGAGADTLDPSLGVVQFNRDQQTQTLPAVPVDATHLLLSTITMIAPSPDWFSGFYDFDVRDPDNLDNFLQSFVIETYPWDAGTEQGDTYSTSNDAESPAQEIFQLTTDTVPATGVLLDSGGTSVLPVARWECELVAEGDQDETDTGGIIRGILSVLLFCF